ncbi:restriction endonuclease [Seongchinamella sediminis]|uniref:restriction endonuclease n=1 Tax=Seongchinamella sediminis TaxID=2283635 RepID=UPI0019683D16|nr:restriction endonuclease [Seongchinamella sediminis]
MVAPKSRSLQARCKEGALKRGFLYLPLFFTKEAKDYAQNIDTRIILIDGERLSQLMVDHNVGVSTAGIYEIKKIDSDYFDE